MRRGPSPARGVIGIVIAASPFSGSRAYEPAETRAERGAELPQRFTDPRDEYEAARGGAAVVDRGDRVVVELRGRDRKTWLHNLVTNAVTTLADDAGAYAFACDVRGRVQFDLNILNLPDTIWIDVDRAAAPGALAHLERYHISEDVAVALRAEDFARLGVCGPRAAEIAAALGAGGLIDMSPLSSRPLDGGRTRLIRHDFCGLVGFELVVPRAEAHTAWERAVSAGARPMGRIALDVLRIEAGIPWLGRDIDDTTLPPETGQVDRGVSYRKGCYLGQEILERMRSHGSLARRLVRLRTPDGHDVSLPATMEQGGKDVGRVTSLVARVARSGWVGLGYLRTHVTQTTGIAIGDPRREIEIASA